MTPHFVERPFRWRVLSETSVPDHRASPLRLAGSICLALVMTIANAQAPSSAADQAEEYRQDGLRLATSGQIDQAIASFKRGLEIAPRDPRLLDATGAAYSLKNDLETARQYFIESLNVDPDSVSTRQNLGIALFSLGRYDAAAQQFTSIYEAGDHPRSIASLFLGLIAQKQFHCEEAIPRLEASGNLLYQYPDALLSYAECAYQMGDTKRAKAGLTAFAKLPGSPPAQRKEAADLESRLDPKTSGQDRSTGDIANDAKPDALLKNALLFEKNGQFDEAQNLLESAIEAQPSFDLLFELAKVAKERGDLATAMKSLKRAAQIEPGREDSYLEFSSICADHGNDQLALDSAEIGLDHVPDSYKLTVQKGVVQEKLGHLNDAEATLRKAIGMDKNNSDALLSLAIVQAHSGRADEAEQTLTNAIRQFPDNYYMFYFQGKLLKQFGTEKPGAPDLRDSARRSFEESIRLNPDYADSYYQLSDLYLTDSPKLAEQALEKCLKLDPNHIPAQYSLARLYIRTGRKEEGQALLGRMKTQQRSEELQQQKQLRIEVAQN